MTLLSIKIFFSVLFVEKCFGYIINSLILYCWLAIFFQFFCSTPFTTAFFNNISRVRVPVSSFERKKIQCFLFRLNKHVGAHIYGEINAIITETAPFRYRIQSIGKTHATELVKNIYPNDYNYNMLTFYRAIIFDRTTKKRFYVFCIRHDRQLFSGETFSGLL